MRLLVNVSAQDYEWVNEHYDGIISYPITERLYKSIKEGKVLGEDIAIIDKGKLECDIDWNDYYDGYTAYSSVALESAEILKQEGTEVWQGFHGDIIAPEGTFDRIFNDAEEDDDDI